MSNSPTNQPPIRVLYAEDDPQLAAVANAFFSALSAQFSLEIAATGYDCLARMERGGIDVLLLDLVLPDIDGLNILGKLALRGDRTPVVMISGHGQNELAVRALRAGAVDCVDKSATPLSQVAQLVRRVHQRHLALNPTVPALATLESTEKPHVLLIEMPGQTSLQIAEFIAAHSPNLSLTVTSGQEDFLFHLRGDQGVNAIVIGPNPGSARPLDVLRRIHTEAPNIPLLVLSSRSDGENAVAAFKLGAQDCIFQRSEYLPELLFSLANLLRRDETRRHNQRLARELADLNCNLEAQVAARTQELRALSTRLLHIQEDERRAIARELHDEVGQMLTGLKFQLESAASLVGESPAAEQIREATGTATELMSHVRQLTQLYRPRVLDDLGLAPALEWHLKQFQRQTGIATCLDLNLPARRLPGEIETTLFRIAQEGLTNIARHSGSPTATLTLTHDDSRLFLELTDRGRGFDVDTVLARRDAVGLSGIRERVQLAGGQVAFVSRPGQGTRLEAEFPLPFPLAA